MFKKEYCIRDKHMFVGYIVSQNTIHHVTIYKQSENSVDPSQLSFIFKTRYISMFTMIRVKIRSCPHATLTLVALTPLDSDEFCHSLKTV